MVNMNQPPPTPTNQPLLTNQFTNQPTNQPLPTNMDQCGTLADTLFFARTPSSATPNKY
jgi:hypothetical protein